MSNFSTFYYNAIKRKMEPKRKYKKGRFKGSLKQDRERKLEGPQPRYGVRGQEYHPNSAKTDAPGSSTYTVAG